MGTHTMGLNDLPSQPSTPLTPSGATSATAPTDDAAPLPGAARPPAIMDAELWRLMQTILANGAG
jgi:hypothetical protein